MTKPLMEAANYLLSQFPDCVGCTFEPLRPFGPVTDELDRRLLNVGVIGAVFMSVRARPFTDPEIDAVFHHSPDRDEFERWLSGFLHALQGTQPATDEGRALKTLDEWSNASAYKLMGLPV